MTQMELTNKNAIVIGGARGIGLACVKELLKNGVKKIGIIDYNETIFGEVFTAITQEFGPDRVTLKKADISISEEFEKIFKDAVDELGVVHILHCNAGICGEDIWRTVIAVNLTGTIHGLYLGMEHMNKENGGQGGVIILTSSAVALKTINFLPVYTATKSALVGLTRTFEDQEIAERTGIRVMSICPSLTNTLFNKEGSLYVKEPQMEKEAMANYSESQNKQPQEPERVAEAVVYMIKNGVSGSMYVTRDSKTYEVEIPNFDKNDYKMKQVL